MHLVIQHLSPIQSGYQYAGLSPARASPASACTLIIARRRTTPACCVTRNNTELLT